MLVDSGYAFHLKTNEPWTQSAVGKWGSRGEPMAAYPAIEEWRRWCAHHPAKVRLSNSSTYQGALLQLTQSSPAGMLLEALRALWATVPFMINSARSCAALNGSCTNVDLDQLMANYSAAWDHMLAPALRLGSEAVGEDAARDLCVRGDPYDERLLRYQRLPDALAARLLAARRQRDGRRRGPKALL